MNTQPKTTLELLRADSEKTKQEVKTSIINHYWNSVDFMIHAMNRDGIRCLPNSYQLVRQLAPIH